MSNTLADPGTYAKLPAGTRCLYGSVDDEVSAMKLLKDADAIGVTGTTASFVECTRLLDTEKKFITDLPEGPDKEFTFLDDPSDLDMQAFIAKAEAFDVVKMRIEFPNNRAADMIIVLAGWSMQELDKGKPMYIKVSGKQNAITWGTVTA